MLNKLKISFLTLIITASFLTEGFSQGPKIGYTNLDYILSQVPEAKQVESDLQTYEKQLQTQLQAKYADYEKKLKEYQEASSKGQMNLLAC